MSPARRRLALLVCWSVAVVLASVVPAPSGAVAPSGPFGVGADKWVHGGAYGVTAYLAAAALRARDAKRLLAAVAVAAALGAGVELVQATLPTRAFSVGDAAANAVGAALGALAYAAVSDPRDGE